MNTIHKKKKIDSFNPYPINYELKHYIKLTSLADDHNLS